MLRESRHYADLGIPQVPCIEKCPLWKKWPERATDDWSVLRRSLNSTRINIAGLTGERSGLVVIDLDSMAFANRLYEMYPEIFEVVVETSRGRHVYMRHPEVPVPSRTRASIEGIEADIKGEKNCVMLPPSTVHGYTYRFMRGHELKDINSLPIFPKQWIPQKKQIVYKSIPEGGVQESFRHARRWLAKRPPAVSGQNGHGKMFGAACAMFQMFHLSPELAWAALCEYNERAEPPFSEKELSHKLQDAMKMAGVVK